MRDTTGGAGPHAGQRIVTVGPPPEQADAVLILVHGRGGSAADMIGLSRLVAGPTVACLAPEAAGQAWYPHRFIEPVSRNQPYLGSALSVLGDLVDQAIEAGVVPERIALIGFSQGACLSLEFVRRRGSRLGAVIGLSGGLIGETINMAVVGRPFEGMPVLLGCSERDAHIPVSRVHETDAVLRALGAEVTMRIYPGSGHEVNADEIVLTRAVLARLAGPSSGATR